MAGVTPRSLDEWAGMTAVAHPTSVNVIDRLHKAVQYIRVIDPGREPSDYKNMIENCRVARDGNPDGTTVLNFILSKPKRWRHEVGTAIQTYRPPACLSSRPERP
jgi:hypothetical protein